LKVKSISIVLSLLLLVSTLIPSLTLEVEASGSYFDVKASHDHHDTIMELSNRGVLRGFKDGSFQPEKAVTRGQAAKILAMSLDLDMKNVSNPGFKDVTKSNEYFGPIAALVEKGIFSGKEDGTFQPNEKLTRAHMAKVISLAYGLPIQELTSNPFKDVDENDTWYTNYLSGLIRHKITTGTTNTTYSPYEVVRRGQLASFVVRTEKAIRLETINSISENGHVVLNSKELKLDDSLKGLFSKANEEALVGAKVSYMEKNDTSVIYFLQLTKDSSKLDANSSTFTGNLIIDADHITLKNLVIDGNLTITAKAKESLTLEGVTIKGETIVGGSAIEKSAFSISNIVEPAYLNLNISNSTLKVLQTLVEVNFTLENITISEIQANSSFLINADEDSKIEKVTVLGKASKVEIGENSKVQQLSVNTTAPLAISGKGSIVDVLVLSRSNIQLNVNKITKLTINNPIAEILLGKSTIVTNIALPNGKKIADIIQNYNDVKGNFKYVDGKPNNGTTPTVTTPSSGDESETNNPEPVLRNQSAPTNLVGVKPTAAGLSDGKITGVTTAMEYKAVSSSSWIAITGNELTGLIAGDYDVRYAAKSGYRAGEITKVTVPEHNEYPEGFVLIEDVANVSNETALAFAEQYPDVMSIHLVEGFTISEIRRIEKILVIPADVNEQTFNFAGAIISSIEVNGDDNTLSNATIENLVVSEDVMNLTMNNIKDTLTSTHTIAGGGSESIKLSGNTVFKGEIRITAGEGVQIRTLDESGSKIEGTVWIDGTAPVKISAPVSNVVINSDQPVILNSTVDNLIARSSSSITVAEGVTPPTIQTRIGVTVEVRNEAGDILPNVIIHEVLDKSELEWMIQAGEDFTTNVETDGFNGHYPLEAVETLKSAIVIGKKVRADNTEVNELTQAIIDEAASTLYSEIEQFKQTKIVVQRSGLYEKWKEAERMVDRIELSETESKYSSETLLELKSLITEAQVLYETYHVTQQEVDTLKDSIFNSTEELKSSYMGEGNPFEESIITITIKGDNLRDSTRNLEFIPVSEQGSSHSYRQPNHTVTEVDGGLRYTITDINETEANSFYVLIETDSYVVYEKFTPNEIKANDSRVVTIDDSFVSVNTVLPDNAQEQLKNTLVLQVLDESNKAMFNFSVYSNELVPTGTYNVQYIGVGTEASYGLFKENVVITKDDSSIQFTSEDMKRVEITFEQSDTYNYTHTGLAPLYFKDDKFDTIYHVRLNSNIIYLSDVDYNEVLYTLVAEKDGKSINVEFGESDLGFLHTGQLTIDDEFAVQATLKLANIQTIDINSSLSMYYDIDVRNKANQRVRMHNYSDTEAYYAKGQIVLKANGKTYTKEVDDFGFNQVSIKDIVGADSVSGDATIEFRVEDSLIPIASKTLEIKLN